MSALSSGVHMASFSRLRRQRRSTSATIVSAASCRATQCERTHAVYSTCMFDYDVSTPLPMPCERCFSISVITSPPREMRSIVMSITVCLSARLSQKPHDRSSANFSCLLSVAVAPSCSDGVVVRYVLPVLWMTSCFHTTGSVVHRVHS